MAKGKDDLNFSTEWQQLQMETNLDDMASSAVVQAVHQGLEDIGMCNCYHRVGRLYRKG